MPPDGNCSTLELEIMVDDKDRVHLFFQHMCLENIYTTLLVLQ